MTAGTAASAVTFQVWRSVRWFLVSLSRSPLPKSRGQKGFLVAQVFTWLQLVAGPGGGCYKGEQSRHRKLALL